MVFFRSGSECFAPTTASAKETRFADDRRQTFTQTRWQCFIRVPG